jgi:hypothetical protein
MRNSLGGGGGMYLRRKAEGEWLSGDVGDASNLRYFISFGIIELSTNSASTTVSKITFPNMDEH